MEILSKSSSTYLKWLDKGDYLSHEEEARGDILVVCIVLTPTGRVSSKSSLWIKINKELVSERLALIQREYDTLVETLTPKRYTVAEIVLVSGTLE